MADSGRLADDLDALFEALGEAAWDLGTGVIVPHRRAPGGGAGLPSLPAQLAEATSYAERLYDCRQIGLLEEAAAPDALTVRREVDDGLYRSRWERATPSQRELLRALATLGGDGPTAVADIARAMGRAGTSDISVARNEVIKKGLAYAPERGFLAFTVPGMHDLIARQD